jgi:nucleoid DNA-binding protein
MAIVTKKDLVAAVSDQCGINQTDVGTTVTTLIDVLVSKLADGDEVTLRGLGTLVIKIAKPKKGRNPNNPTHQVIIPERCVIRFRPGKELKTRINSLDVAKIKARMRKSRNSASDKS